MSDPYLCHKITMRNVHDEQRREGPGKHMCPYRGCRAMIELHERVCRDCYNKYGVDGKGPLKKQ